MTHVELLAYFQPRLEEAEAALAAFKKAMKDHGLRVRERDVNGERDVTDRHLAEDEATCQEYRTMIAELSAKE